MIAELTDTFDGVVARLVRTLLVRCSCAARALLVQINALEAELRPLVAQLAPTSDAVFAACAPTLIEWSTPATG